MRESKLTKILFKNFSQEKLKISFLLNISCKQMSLLLTNLDDEFVDQMKNYDLDEKNNVFNINNHNRLTLKEEKYHHKLKISLVKVNEDNDNKEGNDVLCSKSVCSDHDSDNDNLSSFSTKSDIKFLKNTNKISDKNKNRFIDEIQRVLIFGNKIKKITSQNFLQNPTIYELKKFAKNLNSLNKFSFNLSKPKQNREEENKKMALEKIFKEVDLNIERIRNKWRIHKYENNLAHLLDINDSYKLIHNSFLSNL